MPCNSNIVLAVALFYEFKKREGYNLCTPSFVLPVRSKVQALCYAPHAKKLVSCSEDGIVRIWDMNVKRQEVHHQLSVSQSVSHYHVSKQINQLVTQTVY